MKRVFRRLFCKEGKLVIVGTQTSRISCATQNESSLGRQVSGGKVPPLSGGGHTGR